MSAFPNRREFLRATALTGAGLALSNRLLTATSKSILVFTKSSGFEHEVVKRIGGKPSIVDDTVNELGNKHGYKVSVTKDGRIFESTEFHSYTAAVFFTTGDLTTLGTDGKPPMTPQGKQALLNAVKGGMGFVGVHAASDTFHTLPDPEDRSNRYVAHGEQSDPYLRMLGGEFITHGSEPRLQTANLIVNDPKFPGLEGVTSPVSFKEEWYSLKDFAPGLHVILTESPRRRHPLGCQRGRGQAGCQSKGSRTRLRRYSSKISRGKIDCSKHTPPHSRIPDSRMKTLDS